MKKTYEVIHLHDRTLFPTYEDALEFAKEATKPPVDDDFYGYVEYNKALIIIEDNRVIFGVDSKMTFVHLIEFMHKNTWSITDMCI